MILQGAAATHSLTLGRDFVSAVKLSQAIAGEVPLSTGLTKAGLGNKNDFVGPSGFSSGAGGCYLQQWQKLC